MQREINTVAIVGSSGIMGSLTGGLIAQSGFKVYFFSRTVERAESGLRRAIDQARSEVIKHNIVCCDYESFESVLKNVDWIIECTSENLELKIDMYEKIESYRKPESIVSSMTSSLPLTVLCQDRSEDFKKNFLGIHLFNPPTKMLLCEIAPQEYTDPEVVEYMSLFLRQRLNRVVVPVKNVPAYAGNRIGFLFLCEVAKLATETGVEMMDYLIGPYTGRAMSPFSTIDIVGLDTYKAIINSLYTYTNDVMHESFTVQDYIEKMIDIGHLGNKTPDKGGFYRRDIHKNKYVLNIESFDYKRQENIVVDFVEKTKDLIHTGRYKDAFNILKNKKADEADIIRKVLCTYISYSFLCAEEVIDKGHSIDGIDKVMAYGFNWAPPSVILHVLGGPAEIVELMKKYNIPVPFWIENFRYNQNFIFNVGKYFIAR